MSGLIRGLPHVRAPDAHSGAAARSARQRAGDVAALRAAVADRVRAPWRARSAERGERVGAAPDLRLVPIAILGWFAAWLGTSALPAAWAGAAAGAGAALLGWWWRRSAWLLAAAAVIAGFTIAGGARGAALGQGPVADLARVEATVIAELEVRSDLHLSEGRGAHPGYGLLRATAVGVDGRDSAWRVRAPVLVVVTGAAAQRWADVPVGTRVRATGRLRAADPGDDVAAVLRVRDPPTVVNPPPPGLRLVERVRDGLRASVAQRAAEPRALVPALVLGDTSRLSAGLTDDFRTVGLTHLTAVSGANLTLLLAFLLLMARWAGVRGWWLRLVGLERSWPSSRCAEPSRAFCAPPRWVWLRSPLSAAGAAEPACAT